MSLDRAARERLVRALAASMIEHAEELTSLDQAIGDGDHGLNMKRGFEAVRATLPGLADKSLSEMLKAIGMTLVMKVGGASGPLVGTFSPVGVSHGATVDGTVGRGITGTVWPQGHEAPKAPRVRP